MGSTIWYGVKVVLMFILILGVFSVPINAIAESSNPEKSVQILIRTLLWILAAASDIAVVLHIHTRRCCRLK